MSKIHLTAAVAMALAAATPAVYAQTSTTHDTRAAATAPGIQPDEMRASKIIGSAVYDVQNRKIGSVQI